MMETATVWYTSDDVAFEVEGAEREGWAVRQLINWSGFRWVVVYEREGVTT